ncbi:hypothetical protein Taro_003209, partial [Colocasia esculenta]|nr:hypothetical protein [Colocasia esculenta]
NHIRKTITQHKNYPGSDLLSLGVLRPVPEQQLRIPLLGYSPPKDATTPISAGLPSQPKGNNTLDTTRSSFTTEGKQLLKENRMRFKPLDQAFDKQGFEATRTERKRFKLSTLSELHRLSQDFHKLVESKEQKAKRNEVRGSRLLAEKFECLNASIFLFFTSLVFIILLKYVH